MSRVLTESSTVDCGHGGSVSVQGQSKLTVGGSAVLVQGGVTGKSVSALCATQDKPDSGLKKCTTVASVTAGYATKLTIGGSPVVLDTLAGTTDGMVGGTTPQTLLRATAGQSKLTAQ